MTWTKEKPTKSGWFWYKHPDLNMGKPMPAWVFDSHRLMYVRLMAVHSDPVDKNVKECEGEWYGPIEVPDAHPDVVELPERIRNRLTTFQAEIDQVLEGAERLLTIELPTVQFEFVNSAARDVLTDYERAQSVSFVTRFDHLPDECRVTAIEHNGRYDIDNIDYRRHALNEFRPLIENKKDSVYYQKIHNVWYGMLKREDSDKGTTIRAFDKTEVDVTGVCIMWLSEANKAIKFVLRQLDYGYLYNGILQHSAPEYSTRFIEDYTSGANSTTLCGSMLTSWTS